MCKIYFKVNNRSSRQCFSVFNVNFQYIWHFVLVFILFCFYCWLWTCECQMEYFIAFIYLCVSEADLRSPVTFKTKLSITTINNSYQLLAFLSQGAPSLMLFKVWSANILERIGEQSHDQVYCWENMEKSLSQMPQNYISRVFHIDVDCCIVKPNNHLFDFIKPNLIQNSAYKVKYISQINGCFIMFFWKFKNKCF